MGARGTPATSVVAKAGVEHRLLEYDHDPSAPAYGLEAADKLGADPARVFKTLVAEVDGRLVVAVVPVAASLSLKALAAAAAS
jgi:Cys-tRNA(Pro)/Cys-tRNA(Cys) deacylase